MSKKKSLSQLRQDAVSGDWVAISPKRALRPHQLAKKKKIKVPPKSSCPFENLQKTGHGVPRLILDRKGNELTPKIQNTKYKIQTPDWFLQVVPNKYPIVGKGDCSIHHHEGISAWLEGAGFHEIVIYRDHAREPSQFSEAEWETLILGYQKRYQALAPEDCVEYILIYHNHGPEAGASIYHPHSQILALPVIPSDVGRSIRGSSSYWKKYRKCVHCAMINWERKSRKRIVYENKEMIVFCPFAPKMSFETRIFPKRHEHAFEKIDAGQRANLADAMRVTLRKIAKSLGEPSYNFFIHTAPTNPEYFRHYHWHIEILPRTSIWAGVELGTGIEVSAVPPEKAAAYLRKIKI